MTKVSCRDWPADPLCRKAYGRATGARQIRRGGTGWQEHLVSLAADRTYRQCDRRGRTVLDEVDAHWSTHCLVIAVPTSGLF